MQHDGPKLKVLLADDSNVTRLVFSSLLKRSGHEVVMVSNGNEAFMKCKSEQFNLILMDVQMPVMNGLSATKLIRANEALTGTHTPILALTAADSKADLEHCVQAGMDGYLHKNITAGELHDVLQCYLNPVRQKEAELNDGFEGGESNSSGKGEVREGAVFTSSAGENRNNGPEEGMHSLLVSLRQAFAYRDESLMEQSSLKMKRMALHMKSEKLADATFRVQLAFRRGDFDTARHHLRSVEDLVSRTMEQPGFELDMDFNR